MKEGKEGGLVVEAKEGWWRRREGDAKERQRGRWC